MKRTRALLRLTPLVALLPLAAQQPPPALDLEVRHLTVASGDVLCAGLPNALRVELRAHGAAPRTPVPLRLALVLPGGDAIGVTLAEGSLHFAPGAASASFTFLNVDVPARLRGRDARLEARVNVDRGLAETDYANNVRAIRLDEATDFTCRG